MRGTRARLARRVGALAMMVAVTACAGTSMDDSPGATRESTPPPTSTGESEAPVASTIPTPGAADPGDPTPTPVAFDDALLAIELRDVRTDATFTLGELAADGPVIVETMAIWCTNCRSQMHQITAAHELADFHSVSIDVEPTEIAEDLVAYAAREGFDWPFVLADAELATALRDRFGNEVLFPPGMPKLLIRTDGSIELLPLGELLSAEQIASLVEG